MIPLSKKDLTAQFRADAKPDDNLMRKIVESPAQRVAVFAIHGISPIQQYAFQDQVALALESFLNSQLSDTSTFTWKSVVHWPQVAPSTSGEATVRPSALRIYRSDEEDPEKPENRVYDVYEGYWSPLSKGKTSIGSALRWLLNATFLGNSSTAAIPCTSRKLAFDLSYVTSLLVVALLACAAAFALGLFAWQLLAGVLPSGSSVSFEEFVNNPLQTAFRLPLVVYAEFIIDVVIGYVVVQLITAYNASRKRAARARALRSDADKKSGTFDTHTINAGKFHAAMLGILWSALAVLILIAYVIASRFQMNAHPTTLVVYIATVALLVAFLQLARSIGDFAVENVLGDVQIYTTHDSNLAFYTIRQQIIENVAGALHGVLRAVFDAQAADLKAYYDSVHVFGHSLGSTVGMDVLIRLRQMVSENGIAPDQWTRIRSFTTFGTSLEKTRFFFDVRQPTLNAAQDQWEDDVYGRFFTNDLRALDGNSNIHGIYWSNHWYFHDIVSNEIVSYKSDSAVGHFNWTNVNPRPICENFEISHKRPLFAWVHSDYLGDPAFWKHVGPIVTM
jgi:pimeloyl-ACP methyl ester carboxylesterase